MEIIKTETLPSPVGSYSQAVKAGNTIFISGQIAYDCNEKKLLGKDINIQTKCIMNNISNFLIERGLTFDDIIKVNVFLDDMSDFSDFDEIYSSYFNNKFPARAVVGHVSVPKGMLIELEVIIEEN